MPGKIIAKGINNPEVRQVLLVFSSPQTHRQAKLKLSVKNLKLRPFLETDLLKCLNPDLKKGRFYTLTQRARDILKIECNTVDFDKDWEMIGWVIASPQQRLVALRSVDEKKLCSEEVRIRATMLNCHISRISMKNTLKELMQKQLVDTEILQRERFYWISTYGQKIKNDLAVIVPLFHDSF